MVTGRPAAHSRNAPVCDGLLLLAGPFAAKEEFSAHEANAVTGGGVEAVEFPKVGDIEVDGDRGSVRRYAGLEPESGLVGSSPRCRDLEAPELVEIAFVRTDEDEALGPVDERFRSLPGGGGRVPDADDHRHAAATRQHRNVARRAAVGENDGAAAPIRSEEAGGCEIRSEDDGARRDRRERSLRQERRAHGRAYP